MAKTGKHELYHLLNRLCERMITADEFNRLEELLTNDRDACEIYVDFMSLWSDLRVFQESGLNKDFSHSNIREVLESPGCVSDSGIWRALLKDEKEIPAVEIPCQEKESETPIIYHCEKKSNSKPGKFSRVYNVLISIAAALMILLIVYANVFPPQYSTEVATVKDLLSIKWESASERLLKNERLQTNQAPFILEKGVISLTYDEGVDVIIEGPAEFTIEKMGIELTYGRLYSYVSDIGHGFTIDTPTNRFVDLGTEFGIYVSKDSSSELHVFKGEVQCFAGQAGSPKTSRVITHDNAIRFDTTTGKMERIQIEDRAFARNVDSETGVIWRGQDKIDIASIIAGLDGFNGIRTPLGISPLSGEISSKLSYNRSLLKTNNKYNRVVTSNFIDGVFVPDGGKEKVVISSTGLEFFCPDTSGKFGHNICTFTGEMQLDNDILPVVINDYNINNTPDEAVLIHSNCGITIDLKAIREATPKININSFTAWGGITESIQSNDGDVRDVCFYILIDGIARYEKTDLDIDNNLVSCDIEINDNDRFLTFIVTDGLTENDQRDYPTANDFFYLINPQLNLLQ